MARTEYAQRAWLHTSACDELDSLMDLLGVAQRRHQFDSPAFVAVGRVRQAMCDAQQAVHAECRWVGTSD